MEKNKLMLKCNYSVGILYIKMYMYMYMVQGCNSSQDYHLLPIIFFFADFSPKYL